MKRTLTERMADVEAVRVAEHDFWWTCAERGRVLCEGGESGPTADDVTAARLAVMRARKNEARRDRDDVMRSCGLVRVRGAMGGVYWE